MDMVNALQFFENSEFGKIRTMEENGKVLFCGNDVAKALGYKRPNDAISAHCRGTVKRRITDSIGREQEMNFIPEGDIYRLAAKSELPGADRFESWIFDEVIPSIRKNGGYIIPKDYPAALRAYADEVERRLEAEKKIKELSAENEIQRQTIEDFKPIKTYVDTIFESKDAMTITQIAKDYDLTANKANKILHDAGIQYKVNDQWVLYRDYMGKGYTTSRTIPITYKDGTIGTKVQTLWTQKGRMMIHNIFTQKNIIPAMDRNIK